MPFFWTVPGPVPPSFFASHLGVIVAIHLLLAALLADRCDDRPWALAALALPIALALWPSVHAEAGTAGVWVLFAATAGVCALGVLPLPGRGAPLIAVAVGAALGGTMVGPQLARAQTEVAAAPSVAACAIAVGILLLAARLPRGGCVPRPPVTVPIAVLAVAAAIFLGRVAPSADLPRPPMAMPRPSLPPAVLIVLDTVRVDHLQLYGYERDTMPRLNRFAREQAVVIDGAVANSPHSLPTHASLFTGLTPPRHGAQFPSIADPSPPAYAYPLARHVPTLAGLLSARGYWTVGVLANGGALAPDFGLDRGFAVYDASLDLNFAMKLETPWRAASEWSEPLAMLSRVPLFSDAEFFEYGVPYRRAARISDRAISLIDAAGDHPFFLFVNYFDAHSPYNPPASGRDAFPGRLAGRSRLGLDHRTIMRINSGDRTLAPEERAHLVALYDAELRYLDRHLGRLLDHLQRHPRWNEMLVIVTSDHGEAFGEHRFVEHGMNLYGELTRVPLIVKPGVGTPGAPPTPSRLSRIVESVDLFPIVLAHAGLGALPRIDGRAWGLGREHARTWVRVQQRSVSWRPERLARNLRAIQRDGWKLIEWSTGRLELYDLENDPGETRDLAARNPERRDALRLLLGKPARVSRNAPRRGASETPETLERLRALGYLR